MESSGRRYCVLCDGDVVRREAFDNAGFVRDVLQLLEAQDFDGAPRFVGADRDGREVVSFVPGMVADSERVLSHEQIASAGRLLRKAHDALAGNDLACGQEVVCHGDPGPHNVVFRGDDAVALIDWECAGPGPRLADLANVAGCLLEDRWEGDNAGVAFRRIGGFCRAYGWDDVRQVIDELRAQVQRERDDALQANYGSVDDLERFLAWLGHHRNELDLITATCARSPGGRATASRASRTGTRAASTRG